MISEVFTGIGKLPKGMFMFCWKHYRSQVLWGRARETAV